MHWRCYHFPTYIILPSIETTSLNTVIWNVLSNEIKIWIHFKLINPLPPPPHIAYLRGTNYSELSNFEHVLIVQSSHRRGLSISVLWTMIIHAKISDQNMPSCKSFLCIEQAHLLFVWKSFWVNVKPLARVDSIINRHLLNLVWKPMLKKGFRCGL